MQHRVDGPIDVDVVRDVVLDEGEVAIDQVRDVRRVAGQEVVDADDGVAAVEQGFGEMGADEAGGSGDDDSRHGGSQYACLWKNPLITVSHMILRSSMSDQFSM